MSVSRFNGLEFRLGRRATGALLLALVSACSAPTDSADVGSAGEEPEVATTEAALAGDIFTPQRPVFAGVWNPSTASQLLTLNRNYAQFVDEYGRRLNENLRVTSINSSVVNGAVVHSAIWGSGTFGQHIDLERTAAQFASVNTTWMNNGYRLVSLSSVTVNGQVLYNGVWNPSTTGQFIALGKTESAFLSDYSTQYANGYKLVSLGTNLIGGQVLYTGLWRPSSAGQYLRIAKTRADFEAEHATRTSGGYRLVGLSTYVLNEVVYYAGIWNPGTYTQVLSLDRPEFDLLADYSAQWNNGMRLSVFSADHVEALALNRMADGIKTRLGGTVTTGMGATVAYGSLRARAYSGAARTSTDQPQLTYHSSTRVNVASACKTFTAIGVLRLLRAKGLTASTKIAPYLPSDWVRGANVANITFGEVLSHASGFRGSNANANRYADLKTMVAGGVVLANKVYNYQNQNFALFRVIVPYLEGFNDAGIADKDTETARRFLDYMNRNVFAVAGLGTISATPATYAALHYPVPAAGTPGISFGDYFGLAGYAGFQLSSEDMATLLVKLRDGTLLDASWNELMNANRYGWYDLAGLAERGGPVYRHPGTLGNSSVQVNTVAMSFADGTQAAITVNSPYTSSSPTSAARAAYREAWVPVQ
jgi:CubicO group peptidase (beta-lactamase class C family)